MSAQIVTNRGTIAHTFKLCSNPRGGSANSCVGRVTRLLHPAQSATLTAELKKAGKPSELAFALSKFSELRPDTITFKVRNAGLAFHDFKICTTPVSTTARNACAGVVTKLLEHDSPRR